jgi:DNA-binding CsgD family transcriptional regulator
MLQPLEKNSLLRLRDADVIYNRVVQLSERFFENGEIGDMKGFLKEAALLLEGVKGTDAVIGIFNHNTYCPVLEVGHKEFWGGLPEVPQEERMLQLLGLLEKEYSSFPAESVQWFAAALDKISFEQRQNIRIYHCGICYRRLDGKLIRLFSKGIPIYYDEHRNFTFTYNYVQNVAHLIKKDYTDYWIRMEFGEKNEMVQTWHSAQKQHLQTDLLSAREKEILTLIAEGLDTKEIAERLFISANTVGNHRSNMIERLGARDTTALVQLAKMASII